MALSGADLRLATVAILKDWCKDFGIKPETRKANIIQQLSAHMITCPNEATVEAAVVDVNSFSGSEKEDALNTYSNNDIEIKVSSPVKKRKRCTNAHSEKGVAKKQKYSSLSLASTICSSSSPAGQQQENSLYDNSHEPSPSGTEGQRVWELSPSPSTPAPLSPLVGSVVQHATQHERMQVESEGYFGKSQRIDGEEDDADNKLEGQGVQLGRPQETACETMQRLVSLSVAAAKKDNTAQVPRLVDLRTGMVHSLPNNGIISLGRCSDCEINVPEANDRHCVFFCTGGQVKVEDMGSTGTFINDVMVPVGELLPQHVELRPGDILALLQLDGPSFLFLEGCRRQKSFNATTITIFGGA